MDFVHLGGVGEDVGELSVNCGCGFSAVGVETRQCNISAGQPQHEVRRFRYVSNFCTKSRLWSRGFCACCPVDGGEVLAGSRQEPAAPLVRGGRRRRQSATVSLCQRRMLLPYGRLV